MKKILYIFLFLLLVLASLGLYYILNFNKFTPIKGSDNIQSILSKRKIAGHDVRLFKYYLTTKYISADKIVDNAKKDCLEFKPSNETNQRFSKYYESQRNLRNKLFEDLKLKENETVGLLTVYDFVPETNTCFLVWLVDDGGKGVVAYENKNSKLMIFNSNLAKDRLDEVLKNFPK